MARSERLTGDIELADLSGLFARTRQDREWQRDLDKETRRRLHQVDTRTRKARAALDRAGDGEPPWAATTHLLVATPLRTRIQAVHVRRMVDWYGHSDPPARGIASLAAMGRALHGAEIWYRSGYGLRARDQVADTQTDMLLRTAYRADRNEVSLLLETADRIRPRNSTADALRPDAMVDIGAMYEDLAHAHFATITGRASTVGSVRDIWSRLQAAVVFRDTGGTGGTGHGRAVTAAPTVPPAPKAPPVSPGRPPAPVGLPAPTLPLTPGASSRPGFADPPLPEIPTEIPVLDAAAKGFWPVGSPGPEVKAPDPGEVVPEEQAPISGWTRFRTGSQGLDV